MQRPRIETLAGTSTPRTIVASSRIPAARQARLLRGRWRISDRHLRKPPIRELRRLAEPGGGPRPGAATADEPGPLNRAATALNLHDYRGHRRTWGWGWLGMGGTGAAPAGTRTPLISSQAMNTSSGIPLMAPKTDSAPAPASGARKVVNNSVR